MCVSYSSLSAVLNACALVGIEDILRGWLRIQMKPFLEGLIARVISAVLALISIFMLLVVAKLGGVLGKQNLGFFFGTLNKNDKISVY